MATSIANKTARTLVNAQTVTAGTPYTAATVFDLSAKFGGTISSRITNGASAPSTAAQHYILISHDGTTFYELAGSRQAAGTATSSNYDFTATIPPGILYAKPAADSNTGQNVTFTSYGHEITSVTTS